MDIKVNFGGFVSLSTIDWRGRAVCTLFLRGCPIQCSYCQNESIQNGEDYRDIDEIKAKIREASPLISGVVFSGGEPTKQKEALLELARYAQSIGLKVGIQTNGYYPGTVEALLEERLLSKVALDFKTRWEGYSEVGDGGERLFGSYEKNARKTFKICRNAYARNILREFEVVLTVFYENENYIEEISNMIEGIPLVLQQGEHKIGSIDRSSTNITEGEYWAKKAELRQQHPPLRLEELKEIANRLKRKVRIRTRDIGEIGYNGKTGQ